jgi:hypothetical protein
METFTLFRSVQFGSRQNVTFPPVRILCVCPHPHARHQNSNQDAPRRSGRLHPRLLYVHSQTYVRIRAVCNVYVHSYAHRMRSMYIHMCHVQCTTSSYGMHTRRMHAVFIRTYICICMYVHSLVHSLLVPFHHPNKEYA